MAIIIGSNTQVSGDVQGVVSVQWGISPQINRLWQLGSWDPYSQLATRVTNVSLTIYAGGGPSINLQPASSCTDSSAKLNITISPAILRFIYLAIRIVRAIQLDLDNRVIVVRIGLEELDLEAVELM